jgi:transposase
MKRISNEILAQIHRLHSGGKSLRKMARMVGLHHSTVARHLPGQSAGEDRSAMGRPSLLSPRVLKHVVRRVESGQLRNAKMAADDLKNGLGISASRWTIARSLRSVGLRNYSKPKKPRLLTRHRVDRLRFGRVMKHYSVEDWQRVVFTDESRICLYGPDSDR